jgi:hypothetical protein
MKEDKMGQACNMHRGIKNAYILIGKPEVEGPLGRPRHRGDNNIKIELIEIRYCRVYGETVDVVLDWILDLLTTYTHNSELQVITVPSLSPHFTNHHSTHQVFSSLLCLYQPFPSDGF